MENSCADLRAAAHAAHRAGRLQEAERAYKQLLAGPGDGADAANLGALLRSQGRLADALQVYREALACWGDELSLIGNAANALRDAGELEASTALLERGLQQHPGQPALLQGLAKTWLLRAEPARAQACLLELQQAGVNSHELWFDLGVAQARQGELEQGLACFERALQHNPRHATTAANRITLLKELGRLQEARSALEQAQANGLSAVELLAAEAGLLMAEQEMAPAAALFHGLCERQPLDPFHWLNLAACLRGLKQVSAPARVVKRGLSLNPGQHELQQALLQALAEMGELPQAAAVLQGMELDRLIEKDAHFFNLQFLATSYGLLPQGEQQRLAQAWEQRKRQSAGGMQQLWQDFIPEPIGCRPLRVGYLSSDFCNHPVSRFLLPLLQSHDRREVELWGLHTGPHWDGVSAQVQQCCDHWLDLRACSDLQAARMISDQRLDVLVELGGYTGNSRIGICVHQPAPLQVSYLGYPGATYLEAVPGWIGDATLFAQLAPEQRQHHGLEVAGGYMAFPRPVQAPEPCRHGPRRFRFGSFNHGRKLTDATLRLWGALLQQAPDAELVLKSISFLEPEERQRIEARCRAAGIPLQRLVLLPWAADLADHLAQYNQIDLALDPIPYGGATTTAEALWMGVPVIALHGPGMVGGLSASLLAGAGQPQWIAHSPEHYLQLCVEQHQQGARSTEQRLGLCEQLAGSALNDPRRVARELERLFRQALAGEV